ncbi:MAG: aldo/keto reductase [Planctomycetota bacterium]|jgi:predicted aldo/keto reductase-like oxidoreductase
MKENQHSINRRNFLKTIGAAGLGAVSVSTETISGANKPDAVNPNAPTKTQKTEIPKMPRRKLGKTGVEVSCLSLGGDFSFIDKQIILRKAFESGVTYWDTAYNYGGGNAELGIGKYLTKNPDARKKLFIVSKPALFRGPITAEKVESRFQTSLKRMNTKYIDLYYAFHGLSDPERLTDEIKQWAKSAKKRKLIRFFGFSTHKNMAKCLAAAAKLDWIDAITTLYNFRVMQDPELQAAIEACHKAGIGLTAMKAFSRGVRRLQPVETEEDKKLLGHFQKRGFTEEQAKIKVVLQDKRFSAVSVGMQNISLLTTNVDAVLNKTKLSNADIEAFKEYAQATCSTYCAGCAYICDSTLPDTPYISDIMRYLMYYNSYGDRDRAREFFAQIPARVRNRLLSTDYSLAETHCPQHLPIAKLVAEAVSKLA